MKKFRISAVILDKTHVVRSRNGLKKNQFVFENLIPGIHFDETDITVRTHRISIGYRQLEFESVQDSDIESMRGKTFIINTVDSLEPGLKTSLYIEGCVDDFIDAFFNNQLLFSFVLEIDRQKAA